MNRYNFTHSTDKNALTYDSSFTTDIKSGSPKEERSEKQMIEPTSTDDFNSKIIVINKLIESISKFSKAKNISFNVATNEHSALAKNVLLVISSQVDLLKYDFP